MERDLDTQLDWLAVDHHNTGHPHTHIIVWGVLDDGRILNIAGDYIAYGIRHWASELVTLELGPQTELEVTRKLASEVEAERLTRLDRMLIAESQERGVVDLRPEMSESYTVRANRHLLIDRAKRLERYDLATEIEPGRWTISEKAEPDLKTLGERGDIIKTMHRALADHGLADERGATQYVTHGKDTESVVGRLLAKGLAGDELGDRLHLIVDGVDGRTHYVETVDASKLDDIRRGHIVALDPVPTSAEPKRPISISAKWRRCTAASTGRASVWKPPALQSSGSMATRTPSSALMSVGWKPCVASVMSSASTLIIGKSPRTLPSGA
jgi:type IV secretory pathway VirD2 relaxase